MSEFKLPKRAKDITGQRFGMLIAIEPIGKSYNNTVIWKCECDCGKTTEVETRLLNSGNTRSSGC